MSGLWARGEFEQRRDDPREGIGGFAGAATRLARSHGKGHAVAVLDVKAQTGNHLFVLKFSARHTHTHPHPLVQAFGQTPLPADRKSPPP